VGGVGAVEEGLGGVYIAAAAGVGVGLEGDSITLNGLT